MSVFTQTQEQPATTRKEWSPSAVMDIQIYHLCRTLHFLVVRVGDPVFAHAIRDDSSVRLLDAQSENYVWHWRTHWFSVLVVPTKGLLLCMTIMA